MGTTSSGQGAKEVYGAIGVDYAIGNNSIATGQVSVGTGATLIAAVRSNRRGILVVQHGTTAVYLGASNVATSTGVLLTGTAGTSIFIPTTAALYGIAGSAQTVSYLEVF
ncbi:MAG: hypothetical protein L0287_01710 [Anaerolineae bacterium]|nr:hypothetical protein [Anaerolineae bacterium]